MSESAAVDKRVVKTKRSIHDALLNLLEKKPLTKISTTELCREADINRNTFYAHYATPDDVLEEMVGEYLGEVSGFIASIEPDDIFESTCQLLRVLRENERLCILLRVHNISPDVFVQSVGSSRQAWFTQWRLRGVNASKERKESVYAFMSAGYSAAVFRWLKEGSPEPVEVFARCLVDMSRAAMIAGFGGTGRPGESHGSPE